MKHEEKVERKSKTRERTGGEYSPAGSTGVFQDILTGFRL